MDESDVLTKREGEVLVLLANGHSNKDIADKLSISARTAELHRLRVMHKLRFRSISDLVLYAVRNGLITP